MFWTFVRSNFLIGSFNFERMQSMGFCVSMMPILKRVYGDSKEEMKFLTEGESVLGLLVMGALVAKWTTVNMSPVISEYDNAMGGTSRKL